MGNWFRAAGYDTYWKGKWHISDADLYQPSSYNPLPSYNDLGGRDPYLESVYLEAERLEQYGFTGFIGPEPHGSNPLNSGSSGPAGRGRDEVFADLNVEQLQKLRRNDKPWLLVASFVNPHDITVWGSLTLAADASGQQGSFYLAQQLAGSNVPRDLFGIAIVSAGGGVYSAGDAEHEFAIMSVSKPFVFALVCQALGPVEVREKLGVNATGLPFNSLAAVEPGLRAALEAELSRREFLPLVERIEEVSDSEPAEWTVATDRGRRRFKVAHADDILRLPDGGAVITDTFGVRYTIPSLSRLDTRSRRFFEKAQ
jgi:hypothetical protein